MKPNNQDTSALNYNQIHWTIACVNEYARYKSLDVREAFRYLFNFGGIKFLKDHYDAEHLLSFYDAVEDLDHICRSNGGTA